LTAATTTSTALTARVATRGPRSEPHMRDEQSFASPRRRALDHLIRPTRAEISASALRSNLNVARRLAGTSGVMAVVKANAYGHGAVQVARVLEDEGVELLGVALVEEGLELRNAGIASPILVMGGSYDGAWELMIEHQLTPMLFRFEHLEGLIRAATTLGQKAKAHLKLDTGMSRLGVQRSELLSFLAALRAAQTHVELEGFLSHFANADLQGDPITAMQMERFAEGLAVVRAAGFEPKWRHLSNTAGVLSGAGNEHVNLVRPGILLYGVAPDTWLQSKAELAPVLCWKSALIHLKTIEAGTAVSYGGTWVAKRPTVVGTLPVGYADGFGRIFSNRAQVLVRGQRAPIIGRVTMDMSLVDVTDIAGVTVNDEVVVLGSQGGARIDADELATLSDTIPYEVMCSVGARVPRVLVK